MQYDLPVILPVLVAASDLRADVSALDACKSAARSEWANFSSVTPMILLTAQVPITHGSVAVKQGQSVILRMLGLFSDGRQEMHFQSMVKKLAADSKASELIFLSEVWHIGEDSWQHYSKPGMTVANVKRAFPADFSTAFGAREAVFLQHERWAQPMDRYIAFITKGPDGKRLLGEFEDQDNYMPAALRGEPKRTGFLQSTDA